MNISKKSLTLVALSSLAVLSNAAVTDVTALGASVVTPGFQG